MREIRGENYYSTSEAAAELGIDEPTMFQWAISGRAGDGTSMIVTRCDFPYGYYIAERTIKELKKPKSKKPKPKKK